MKIFAVYDLQGSDWPGLFHLHLSWRKGILAEHVICDRLTAPVWLTRWNGVELVGGQNVRCKTVQLRLQHAEYIE